jgi:biotin synthase
LDLDRTALLAWLRETDPARLDGLWREADAVRRRSVGDAVHLRGLIEFSNCCRRRCAYCGLRAGAPIERYRLSDEEIAACARLAAELGYGTVVLQSGEDPGIDPARFADTIRRIKAESGLAVTLSLGEQDEAALAAWRAAGADRYFLRFETSNRGLFEAIHPPAPATPGPYRHRLDAIALLKRLGYETGSGIMIGLPGQRYEDLACDIELFRDLELDMIGVGPFIPHPGTPLGSPAAWPRGVPRLAPEEQVPATDVMTYTVLALTRLACPLVNLPSTTALETVNPGRGREAGLACGANVVMPNLTPLGYRSLYAIYPGKGGSSPPEPRAFDRLLRARLAALGRTVAVGPGASPRLGAQAAASERPPAAACGRGAAV